MARNLTSVTGGKQGASQVSAQFEEEEAPQSQRLDRAVETPGIGAHFSPAVLVPTTPSSNEDPTSLRRDLSVVEIDTAQKTRRWREQEESRVEEEAGEEYANESTSTRRQPGRLQRCFGLVVIYGFIGRRPQPPVRKRIGRGVRR